MQFTKNIARIMVGLMLWLGLASAWADMVSDNYMQASTPKVKQCGQGYNVFAGDVTRVENYIQGALPFSMMYRGSIRQNISAVAMMYQGNAAGWIDNYSGAIDEIRKIQYLSTYDPNPEPVSLFVRLPGQTSQDVFFQSTIVWFGQSEPFFSRLNDSDPVGKWRTGTRSGGDTGAYQFKKGDGYYTINLYGVIYKASFTARLQTGSPNKTGSDSYQIDRYRITEVSYPNGKKLTMSYDGIGNLTRVADNRGNILTVERNFKESPFSIGQTDGEKTVISAVTLKSGSVGAEQRVDFNYQTQNVYWIEDGSLKKKFLLQTATSTMGGKVTYVYKNQYLPAVEKKAYTQNSDTQLADYKANKSKYDFPILATVKDENGNAIANYDIKQDYAMTVGSDPKFSKATTTLTSYAMLNGTRYSEMQSEYDDVGANNTSGTTYKITTTYAANGVEQSSSEIKISQNVVSVTGSLPCISVDGHMVKSLEFSSYRSLLQSVSTVSGQKYHFYYTTLDRIQEKTHTAKVNGVDITKTTTYKYTTLYDTYANGLLIGDPNIFSVPNIIEDNGVKTTNSITAQGQVYQQTTTSTQAGSQSKTVKYEYYTDATQSNYGLLKTKYGPRHGQTVGQIINFVDKTVYTYDKYGNLETETVHVTNMHNTDNSTNTIERTTTYTGYNNAGQPKFKVYPNAKVTEYVYDDRFRLTDEKYGTLPSGAQSVIALTTTRKSYNTLNQVTSETDADGVKTSYEYDTIGRLVKTVYATGEYTKVEYWPNSVIKSSITYAANGTVLAESYQDIDTNGRVSATRSGADGNKLWVKRAYDSNGNVKETTTAQGIINKWDYDGFDRMYQYTDGNGKVHTKQYDVLDNIFDEKANNASGSTRSFVNGQLVSTEQNTDAGSFNTYYDSAFNSVGVVHEFRYCSKGEIDQLGRSRYNHCYFDPRQTDPSASFKILDVFGYDYSGYGRLDWVRSDSVGDPSQPNGKIGVTTSYGYDDLDRITQKVQFNNTLQKWGLNAQNLVAQYSYTIGGKPKTITLPSGKVITYVYNENGTLNSVNAANRWMAQSISTDMNGRLRGWWWGTQGARYWVDYNTAGQTTRILSGNPNQNGEMFDEQYFVDADGRITSKMLNSNLPFGYAYDKNNQLTGDVGPGFKIGYVYDANGNRTRRTWDGGGAPVCAFNARAYADYYSDLKGAFGYDEAKLKEHWLTYGMTASEHRSPCGAQLPQCAFDPEMYITIHPDLRYAGVDGREHYKTYGINEGRGVCSIAASTHHYNYEGGKNRLASYLQDNVNQNFSYQPTGELVLNSILGGAIAYDYMGRKKAEGPNGQTWWFDYNHKNERTLKGGPKYSQFVYDENSLLLGEYTTTGQPIMEYVWVGDKPIAVLLGDGRIGYIVTDHKNTPRRVMDADTGQLLWAWDSDGFGVIQPQVQRITLNLRFPGQYYDEQSGLYYNHNRYYNPQLGRYVEPDPIGLEGGLNPYSYAGNNPVMNTDSTGLIMEMGSGFLFSTPNIGFPSAMDNFNSIMDGSYYGWGESSYGGSSYTSTSTCCSNYVQPMSMQTGSFSNGYTDNLSALTISYGQGGSATLGRGLGMQAGGYFTTGGINESWDVGSYGTISSTAGLGFGVGSGFDIWKGGHDVFDGKSETLSMSIGPATVQLHTISNPGIISFSDITGAGISWGGTDLGGGVLGSAGFVGSKDTTTTISLLQMLHMQRGK